MTQFSLNFQLDRDATDALGDALIARGALAVNVEDADEGTAAEKPIFGEPGADGGLWDACKVSVLLAVGMDEDAGRALLTEACIECAIAVPSAHLTAVADLDWVQHNRDQFQPIEISARIWIVPTWHLAPNPNATNIVLDPGAAFGTGSHPTTRLCLQWIEQQVSVSTAKFLDYGTGSGVLAIAAMKLGAQHAVGTDIDSQAVEAARFNASQNNVDIDFFTTDVALNYIADITVANILANPLKVLAPLLAGHTRRGGQLALAGILDAQADDIVAIYAPYFTMHRWRSDQGWACITGTRI